MYVDLDIVGDKLCGWYVGWDWGGVNPFPAWANPSSKNLKYIRRIAVSAIATREHFLFIELCSTLVY